MPYLVSIYCIITAISVVLSLLKMKLLLAAFMAFAAIFALAIGDDLRSITKRNRVTDKMIHAIMAILMLFVALWLGRHFRINLYVDTLPGTLWVLLGVLLAFAANRGFVERRKFRR